MSMSKLRAKSRRGWITSVVDGWGLFDMVCERFETKPVGNGNGSSAVSSDVLFAAFCFVL